MRRTSPISPRPQHKMAAIRRAATLHRLVVARGVATATSNVKPPIQVFGVEGRYSTALYSAAYKSKTLEKTETELKAFETLVAEKPAVLDFILNPMVQTEQKLTTMNDLLGAMKFSPTTINLFKILAENNRLTKLQEVIRSYMRLMAAHRGELSCSVTTAKPLKEAEVKSLEKALKGFMKESKVLKLERKVDPDIVGGMVLEVGDKFIDLSTKTRIKKLVSLLRESTSG